MRVLVLGGTWFVGRAIMETLARRHAVTVFNRGRTAAELPAGVSAVRGDRTEIADLRRLAAAGPWDVVIDVPGVVPAVVRDAAQTLEPVAERYVFVSTVSAYHDWPATAVSEESPLHESDPDERPAEWTWGTGAYSRLKPGAEAAVLRAFGKDRIVIVRPGVIVGRYEYGGRLPWWLDRAKRGGSILAPAPPEAVIRPIDVFDVAAFVARVVETQGVGAYNVAGSPSTFDDLITSCLDITGGSGSPVWVDDEWLVERGVRQWTELPLWRLAAGTWAIDTTKAQAAGLVCRPLRETVADTWQWLSAGGTPIANDRQALHGLAPAREAELLAAWAKDSSRW